MIDILVFLFENYFHTEAYPDSDTLARKLSAAGFEDDDINEALDWLSGLEAASESAFPPELACSTALRSFADVEINKLDSDSRGFVQFLENAGVVNPLCREIILERAMALDDKHVTLDKIKVIVLMVLWSQRQSMSTLILEELLADGRPAHTH
jgi:Smg protein